MQSQARMIQLDRSNRLGASRILSQPPTRSSRPRSHPWRKKIFYVVVALVIGFGIYGATLLFSFFSGAASHMKFSFWQQPVKPVDSRINIAMFGIGGGNHDGALLTDSIIVASYYTKTHKVVLISVPRDLWVDNLNGKINSAYEMGMEKKNGGNGLKFAEEQIGDVVGLPIQYGVVIDFSGFSQAIDAIGGVDVDVPQTFDDYEYPIAGKEDSYCGYTQKQIILTLPLIEQLGLTLATPATSSATEGGTPVNGVNVGDVRTYWVDSSGNIAPDGPNLSCRYMHVHFTKGPAHMNGTTALEFVRSRHGNNGEGSDFARSRRQQLVIQSFREKALSLGTWSNPQKAITLMSSLGQSFQTDMPIEQFPTLYGYVKAMSTVDSVVLGDLGNGKSLLINPPVSEYGSWVLIPPNNDFTQIHQLIQQKLVEQASASATETN